MISFDHSEAQLFRLLVSFFGNERVIPCMSVMAVCGGALPADLPEDVTTGHDIGVWAKKNKCLFTVVDGDDAPKLVVEFFAGFSTSVNTLDVEHQRYLKPILRRAGIPYITISNDEFDEILDPDGKLDFVQLLQDKFQSTQVVRA